MGGNRHQPDRPVLDGVGGEIVMRSEQGDRSRASRLPLRRAGRRLTAVLGALALAFVSLVAVVAEPARAVTTCSNVWYTIEVGTSPGHFARPRSDGLNAVVYGNGTAAAPWNNYFQLCRDPGWENGDYALRANLGGHYLKVNYTRDLIMGSDRVEDTYNLLRIRNYDGNFQTLYSPTQGLYVGPGPVGQLSVTNNVEHLTGANLY